LTKDVDIPIIIKLRYNSGRINYQRTNMGCKIGTKCYLQNSTVSELDKSVEVVLSDETEVVRFSWEHGEYYLTLLHDESAINLERAEILSLFINHDTNELPIGRFTNVRIEDKKLKATAMFDEDDVESMKIFKKLSKGFLQSFSVGISIDSKTLVKEEDGVKYYEATKWSLNEASVVGIPAIPSAKVGLNHKATDAHAPSVKTANSNTGVTMKFNRDDLDETEQNFQALVLNRDTLQNRNESLKLDLETKTVALETLQKDMEALTVSTSKKVAGAEAKLEGFKTETTTRLNEAISVGVPINIALAMVNADTTEASSKLALDSKESDGKTQTRSTEQPKSAWDEHSFKRGEK